MLLSSIKSIDTFHEPWTHHIFRNALSIEQIKEVQNANVIGYTMKKNTLQKIIVITIHTY